jgi:hypothetical protein
MVMDDARRMGRMRVATYTNNLANSARPDNFAIADSFLVTQLSVGGQSGMYSVALLIGCMARIAEAFLFFYRLNY